jgi:hypothetical protein
LKQGLGIAVIGGVSLLALAMALPGEGAAQRAFSAPILMQAPAPISSVGSFTPAVRNPHLAAELARRAEEGSLQFTPAVNSPDRDRAIRVAVRARPGITAPERARPTAPGASLVEAAPGVAILPMAYNLGAAIGWRRFAITGDVASSRSGGTVGSRETTTVGAEYRATRRLTTRVSVAAEKAEGIQRITGDDRAYSLDVAGSYSIARGIDVTGGVRYRVSRDRLDPVVRDDRRDSQAVYIGTAIRF